MVISPEVLKLDLSLQQLNDIARPYYGVAKKELPVSVRPIFGKDGAFWYRGYFMAPRAGMAEVDQTLTQFQAKQIVVGHTIVDRNIAVYYGSKAIGIDVDQHSGKHYGILVNGGSWQVADDIGRLSPLVYSVGNDSIKPSQIL